MPYLTPTQREQCNELWDALVNSSDLNTPRKPQAASTPEPLEEPLAGARLDWSAIKAFMLAGKATFTIRSMKTGKRFTYKVRQSKPDTEGRWINQDRPVWFVSLLTGPDNGNDYTYLGMITDSDGSKGTGGVMRFSATKKSLHLTKTLGYIAMDWTIRAIQGGNPNLAKVEVWHMGKCGRCGRALTVPESIAVGLGPECATKGGF